MDLTPMDYIIQGGGFALAAYLVVWLTKRLNGKLDRLADAMYQLSHTIEKFIDREESRHGRS